MFDSNTNNKPILKTTGFLNLFDGWIQFDLSGMSVSGLEQLILLLNLMKREADAVSDDGKGSSRFIISGYFLNDWIDDAMKLYNASIELISSAKEKKE